jgi:hypothetical protein
MKRALAAVLKGTVSIAQMMRRLKLWVRKDLMACVMGLSLDVILFHPIAFAPAEAFGFRKGGEVLGVEFVGVELDF